MRESPETNVARLSLLTGAFGVVFLARNSLGYLSPYLGPELQLTGEKLGWLAAAFSIAWAASGFAAGKLGSALRERTALVALCVALGGSSLLMATASTFLLLFLARLLAGASSGPTLPLIQSFAASLGPASRRGLRMGFVQGVGSSVIGSILAPLILIPIAVHWHWETSLLLVGAAAFIAAGLLFRFLPETAAQPAAVRMPSSAVAISRTAKARNVGICCAICAAMACWLIVSLTFFPAFLLGIGYTSAEMSALMSAMGAGGLIGAILVPHLSDRYGRRELMIASALSGALGPAALLIPQTHFALVFVAIFVGGFAGGTLPLCMAIIPSDSVEPAGLPAAIGRVQGAGELVGGVAAPIMAGMAADRLDAAAPVLIVLASSVVAVMLSLGLERPAIAARAPAG